MYLEVFLIISLCRNFIGDEDCLKPSLTEMKLEPADSDSTELQQSVSLRKVDKVREQSGTIYSRHTRHTWGFSFDKMGFHFEVPEKIKRVLLIGNHKILTKFSFRCIHRGIKTPLIEFVFQIRAILTDHVSPESHRTVENILDQVNQQTKWSFKFQ